MSGQEKSHACAKVKPESLLLYAYGEERPPELARHLEECAACRKFIADLEKTRRLAASVGHEEPRPSSLAFLKAEAQKLAKKKAVEKEEKSGTVLLRPADRPKKKSATRFSGVRVALALAAGLVLVVAAVIFMEAKKETPASVLHRGQAPEFLADISARLDELGQSMEAAAVAVLGESGEEIMVSDTDEELESLELALAELEEEVVASFPDIETLPGESSGAGSDEQSWLESSWPEEEEDFSIPLLPGLVDDTSL